MVSWFHLEVIFAVTVVVVVILAFLAIIIFTEENDPGDQYGYGNTTRDPDDTTRVPDDTTRDPDDTTRDPDYTTTDDPGTDKNDITPTTTPDIELVDDSPERELDTQVRILGFITAALSLLVTVIVFTMTYPSRLKILIALAAGLSLLMIVFVILMAIKMLGTWEVLSCLFVWAGLLLFLSKFVNSALLNYLSVLVVAAVFYFLRKKVPEYAKDMYFTAFMAGAISCQIAVLPLIGPMNGMTQAVLALGTIGLGVYVVRKHNGSIAKDADPFGEVNATSRVLFVPLVLCVLSSLLFFGVHQSGMNDWLLRYTFQIKDRYKEEIEGIKRSLEREEGVGADHVLRDYVRLNTLYHNYRMNKRNIKKRDAELRKKTEL